MLIAIALHVLAVVVWVGGMGFMLFMLRPGLAPLPPAERLGVLARVLTRFLPAVGAAVVVIAVTGGWLMSLYGGMRNTPWGVHVMVALGVVMILVYAWIIVRLNPRMQAAVRTGDLPSAATLAERIRRYVVLNFVLGVVVIVAAIVGRGG
ncbi:MAG TPA: CopD family protein [Casimicrobiaceae bacterium]|jgi:uncharacterized membrane protein|nr:CopD family protein [Casimicrobiaceae bacterium]